jgi:hypothetical protein
MPLTDEQRKQIVPELNAAALHLAVASERLCYLDHDLRKLGKGPRRMISRLVRQIDNMKFHLRGQDDADERSIVGRLMAGSSDDELRSDLVMAGKACRAMLMSDLSNRTHRPSAPTDFTPPPRNKGKIRTNTKKLLHFDGRKSKPRGKT